MTDQTAQAEQTPASEAPPKQTLEELYDTYNVSAEPEAPAQPVATPAVETTPEQQPGTEDYTAIRNDLAQLRAEREADKRATQQREEEADLNKAVAILGKEAGLEGKDSILRGFLIAKATEDPRLRALWDARLVKPKAWREALSIFADEVREEFSVPNPQLEENQRAMEESQRAGSTAPPQAKSFEEKAMSMNDPDFQEMWRKLAGRSY